MSLHPSRFLAAEILLRATACTELDFYRLVHDAASKLVTVDAFYLCRVQRSPDWLHFVYNCEGNRFDCPDPLPIANGPTSWVANTGKPKIIVQSEHAVGLDYIQFADVESHTWSAIHWPLWIDVFGSERPDGVLSVQAYPHGAYDQEDLEAIEWLALRTADLIRQRSAMSNMQAQITKAEQISAQNRAVSDAKKFNTLLEGLASQGETPHALREKIRATQVDIAHWASTNQAIPDTVADDLVKLSDRELQVLIFVAEGRSTKEVGQSLCLSEHTIKRHLDNVYSKTKLKKRADVIAAAHAIRKFHSIR